MGEPQQLGRYELGAEIGRGSHGIVYKARDPIIDRVVALKTIDFRRLGEKQGESQDRFFQEAKSAGRLSHPNIVTIYDAGEAQGCAYIAMELLEGCSLREMLDGQHPTSVGRALEITAQIARGLAYAHEHGVVHRDVKPANVILVGSRRAKITDFGIASLNAASTTAERELAGSPKYMSPEQIQGKKVDGRSDLFSLGTILYEMLTGKQPFDGDNLSAIMQAVQEETPQAPSAINAQIPRDVDKLMERMLAKSPEDRHPSARALLRDLTVLLKKYHLKSSSESNKDETVARAKRIKEARRRRISDGEQTLMMTDAPRALGDARRKLPMSAFYSMAAVGVAVLVAVAMNFKPADDAELITPVTASDPIVVQPVSAAVSTNSIAQEIQPPAQSLSSEAETPVAPVAQAAATAPAVAAEKAVKTAAPKVARKATANAASLSSAAATPAEAATIVVAVAPWGEVFIDGESRGTTPPLSNISITPGKHRIEIRNGNLPSYAVEINVGAGDTRRIKHKFE